MMTDHEGLDVPPDEDPDKEILVWTIDPVLDGGCGDYVIERSWQHMLAYVADNLELALEQDSFEERMANPFVLKIGIEKMRVRDWEEICAQRD